MHKTVKAQTLIYLANKNSRKFMLSREGRRQITPNRKIKYYWFQPTLYFKESVLIFLNLQTVNTNNLENSLIMRLPVAYYFW